MHCSQTPSHCSNDYSNTLSASFQWSQPEKCHQNKFPPSATDYVSQLITRNKVVNPLHESTTCTEESSHIQMQTGRGNHDDLHYKKERGFITQDFSYQHHHDFSQEMVPMCSPKNHLDDCMTTQPNHVGDDIKGAAQQNRCMQTSNPPLQKSLMQDDSRQMKCLGKDHPLGTIENSERRVCYREVDTNLTVINCHTNNRSTEVQMNYNRQLALDKNSEPTYDVPSNVRQQKLVDKAKPIYQHPPPPYAVPCSIMEVQMTPIPHQSLTSLQCHQVDSTALPAHNRITTITKGTMKNFTSVQSSIPDRGFSSPLIHRLVPTTTHPRSCTSVGTLNSIPEHEGQGFSNILASSVEATTEMLLKEGSEGVDWDSPTGSHMINRHIHHSSSTHHQNLSLLERNSIPHHSTCFAANKTSAGQLQQAHIHPKPAVEHAPRCFWKPQPLNHTTQSSSEESGDSSGSEDISC